MTQEDLFSSLCQYVCNNVLTFEERRSMGIDNFHSFVRDNYCALHKNELVEGHIYKGFNKYINKARWENGKFYYNDKELNHYEDDCGGDIFVPIEIINNKKK